MFDFLPPLQCKKGGLHGSVDQESWRASHAHERAYRSRARRVAELKTVLGLEPRHFRANLLLGRILTLRGEKDAAIPHLTTAADVQPPSADAKQFLADALRR